VRKRLGQKLHTNGPAHKKGDCIVQATPKKAKGV